jgi:hypothetical protein
MIFFDEDPIEMKIVAAYVLARGLTADACCVLPGPVSSIAARGKYPTKIVAPSVASPKFLCRDTMDYPPKQS